LEFRRVLFRSLLAIAARELVELLAIVRIPCPQFTRGCNGLEPVVEFGLVLARPARPDPVDEDPGPVGLLRLVVDAADSDVPCGGLLLGHPRTAPFARFSFSV